MPYLRNPFPIIRNFTDLRSYESQLNQAMEKFFKKIFGKFEILSLNRVFNTFWELVDDTKLFNPLDWYDTFAIFIVTDIFYSKSIRFEEGREFVRCFINDTLDCSIKKPFDPWGEFFVIDNLINFSQHYSKDIAREIIIGSLRNVRFIDIPFSKEKLKIGQYYWHNDFLIHSNLKNYLSLFKTNTINRIVTEDENNSW